MMLRYLFFIVITICTLLQIRNYNRYRVEHRRQFKEAMTYLHSDVCVDAQTRADLGTFNLCDRAEHILDENPSSAAFYDILNDWYPCGHGRCEGAMDWLTANMHAWHSASIHACSAHVLTHAHMHTRLSVSVSVLISASGRVARCAFN